MDRLFDRKRYLDASGKVPFRLLDGVLNSIHANDKLTLRRMADFIRDRPEWTYVHARCRFIRIIAQKRFEDGFDVIRLEATLRSRQGQDTESEKQAIIKLSRIGSPKDVGFLKELITKLVGRRGRGLVILATISFDASLFGAISMQTMQSWGRQGMHRFAPKQLTC